MSALPKAVRDQVKQAEKLAKEIYDEDGKLKNPAAEPEPEPTPEPAPEPQAQEPAKEPAQEPAKPVDYEHKFKVLQGKYNAEVPRLQKSLTRAEDQNRELSQRMLNLEGMLASLSAVKEPAKEPAKPSLPEITDDERAQFGDDLIDLIERTSLRATLPEVEKRVHKVSERVTQVGEKVAHNETSVAESKRQQVFKDLATAVPNWAEQNENPDFLDWLDQEEGMSGYTRGHFLTEAMKRNDGPTVIKYFKGFQGENAADTAEPAPATEPEPQVKLDELTAPGTPQTGTASAPDESGKRVWSRNDIQQFYADRNEFVKKGKPIPKEMKKLESDIFKAQQEGRIRD